MNINILRYSIFGIAGDQEVDRYLNLIFFLTQKNYSSSYPYAAPFAMW